MDHYRYLHAEPSMTQLVLNNVGYGLVAFLVVFGFLSLISAMVSDSGRPAIRIENRILFGVLAAAAIILTNI